MARPRAVVIDASVALRWIVQEPGTELALAIRRFRLLAPDLLMPECANALWKKAARAELSYDEAVVAAEIMTQASIELRPTAPLTPLATRLAIRLQHPAYDCFYLALARSESIPLVTADARLVRQCRARRFIEVTVVGLKESADM